MQKGFISGLYIVLIFGAITLILGISLKVQSSRLESCKAEHKAFVSEVERLGLEAKEKAKQVEAQDKLRKEVADENLRKLRIANSELSKRVRDNASASVLPQAPSGSRNPELSCFSRSELDGALSSFTRGTTELIIEGTEATLSLDTVKRWAQSF